MSTRELPESFAATLTPSGRGAVAVIGIHGPLAEAALAQHFQRPRHAGSEAESKDVHSASTEFLSPSLTLRATKTPPLRRIMYGTWQGTAEASGPREDVVLTRFETHWELGCHGGAIASAAILADLRVVGIETISWQEWLALTAKNRLQASAAVALAAAQSPAAAIALLRAAELTEAALRKLCSTLSNAPSGASLRSSPATQDLLEKIEALLETARWAKHLTAPWHIVLAGLPNAGKSSLLNALVGYERAIVFEQPGTTRDVVTAAAAYEGWRWELRDTAGLRATDDPLEAAGIERTDAMLAASDVTVLVIDGTRPWSETEPLRLAHPGAIVVRNKSDLWMRNTSWEGQAPAEPPRRVGFSPHVENTIQQKDSKNPLRQDEQEGAELAEKRQERDSTEGNEGNEENATSLTPALSQNESGDVDDLASGEGKNAAPLSVSAVTGDGLEELRAAIHRRLALPSWETIGVAVWDAALAHDLRTLQQVIADEPAALPAALRELRTWIE